MRGGRRERVCVGVRKRGHRSARATCPEEAVKHVLPCPACQLGTTLIRPLLLHFIWRTACEVSNRFPQAASYDFQFSGDEGEGGGGVKMAGEWVGKSKLRSNDLVGNT